MSVVDIKEARYTRLKNEMLERIQKNGHTFMGVGAGDNMPAFMHTMGLVTCGLPELILIGNLPMTTAQEMLENVIEQWVVTNQPIFGPISGAIKAKLFNGEELRAKLVQVDARVASDMWACQHSRVLPDTNPRFAQFLWPDPNNILPDEPGYSDNPLYYQPLLPAV